MAKSSVNLAYYICAQTGVTPMAVGAPGEAKTACNAAFANAVGRKMYTLIGSLRDPADVGGYPHMTQVIHTEGGRPQPCMQLVPPKYAVDCWDGGKWILFIDELTTCPPAVQAALLRVIVEHVVGDMALPPDTWVLSAANPAGIAANGFEIEPPLANRLCHLKWKMDWEAWDKGMMNGLDFPKPEFPVLPADWRDGLSHTSGMLTAFRRKRPSLFSAEVDNAGNLTMDRSAMSGAWPSPRSVTNAAIVLAGANSVDADEGVKYELMEGCVGHGFTSEYFEWARNLDLPDPEEILAAAIKANKNGTKFTAYEHPNRPDKVIALLSGMAHAVLRNNTPDRWEGGMRVLEAAASFEVDVALSQAGLLTKKDKIPKGARVSAEFVERLFPILKRALFSN